MLSEYDIGWMEQEVRGVISGWHTKITILNPLDKDDQPNWNNLLHEYSGTVKYDKYINVPAERKDIQDKTIYDLDIREGAGNTNHGRLLFAVSDTYSFININSIVIYNDIEWRIGAIKNRIGENLLLLDKIVGGNENWDKDPDNVIDVGE